MALDILNVRNITNMEEDTKQAQKCKFWYDVTRQDLLLNLNASFSLSRTVLAEDANYKPVKTDETYGYENAFLLPADCLQVICVDDPKENVLYQIENNHLLCDLKNACPIKYIKDITDVSLYDSAFIKVFALKLAEAICLPLTENEQKFSNIRTLASQEYISASTKYGNDNRMTVINTPRYRQARHNGYAIPTTNRYIR